MCNRVKITKKQLRNAKYRELHNIDLSDWSGYLLEVYIEGVDGPSTMILIDTVPLNDVYEERN